MRVGNPDRRLGAALRASGGVGRALLSRAFESPPLTPISPHTAGSARTLCGASASSLTLQARGWGQSTQT